MNKIRYVVPALVLVILAALIAMVSMNTANASAAGGTTKDCQPADSWTETIEHPAVTHVVHHEAVTHEVEHPAVTHVVHHEAVTHTVEHPAVTETQHHDAVNHTEYHFAKFTHTKYKVRGHWGDYGPWTKWDPETHTSWELSTEPLGTPEFHGQGHDWYREWQAQWDGQTRAIEDEPAYDETIVISEPWTETVVDQAAYDETVVDHEAYTETVVDSEAYDETVTDVEAYTETIKHPAVNCTVERNARTHVKIVDKCNCYRDRVKLFANPDKIDVRGLHPTNRVWVFKVTGKKVKVADHKWVQYMLPSTIGGNHGWDVSQTYKVKTKNQVCPCKKRGDCHVKHPHFVPPADHCRAKGGTC